MFQVLKDICLLWARILVCFTAFQQHYISSAIAVRYIWPRVSTDKLSSESMESCSIVPMMVVSFTDTYYKWHLCFPNMIFIKWHRYNQFFRKSWLITPRYLSHANNIFWGFVCWNGTIFFTHVRTKDWPFKFDYIEYNHIHNMFEYKRSDCVNPPPDLFFLVCPLPC